jgi:hypothetical protein
MKSARSNSPELAAPAGVEGLAVRPVGRGRDLHDHVQELALLHGQRPPRQLVENDAPQDAQHLGDAGEVPGAHLVVQGPGHLAGLRRVVEQRVEHRRDRLDPAVGDVAAALPYTSPDISAYACLICP